MNGNRRDWSFVLLRSLLILNIQNGRFICFWSVFSRVGADCSSLFDGLFGLWLPQ
jgi:hypothetical protein